MSPPRCLRRGLTAHAPGPVDVRAASTDAAFAPRVCVAVVAVAPYRVSRCGQCSTRFRRSSHQRDRCGCSCAIGRSFPVSSCAVRVFAADCFTATLGRVGGTHGPLLNRPDDFHRPCDMVCWQPKTRNVHRALQLPPTCVRPLRAFAEATSYLSDAFGGESPSVQSTHQSMSLRAIPRFVYLRHVPKAREPFPLHRPAHFSITASLVIGRGGPHGAVPDPAPRCGTGAADGAPSSRSAILPGVAPAGDNGRLDTGSGRKRPGRVWGR
jgi:hypothetical protein